MKTIDNERFSCDLCGEFRTRGVTEADPKEPTKVCSHCVVKASTLLIEDGDREPEPTAA
jgi:hypothetical protein